MRALYTTRERIMRAADVKAVAYQSAEIDEANESAAIAIDRLCHRGDGTRPGFAPWTGTIEYDWPRSNNDSAYQFYLNQNSLVLASAITSGGQTVTADTFLRPETGPPYSRIDLNQSTGSLLTIGSGVGQESLAVTGVWCGCVPDWRGRPAWQLDGAPGAGDTTLTLNAPLGVGDLIRLAGEHLFVTEKAWANSGQTGTLTSSNAAVSLAVSDGSVFFPGEELLIEGERVLVRDIAGNTLIVLRAVGGSPLAAHAGAPIYWARTFTVERGVLGTTAAAQVDNTQIYVYRPPALVSQLAIAYAMDQRAQEATSYARTVGTGDAERQATGGGIRALEERVYEAFGRKFRHRGV